MRIASYLSKYYNADLFIIPKFIFIRIIILLYIEIKNIDKFWQYYIIIESDYFLHGLGKLFLLIRSGRG